MKLFFRGLTVVLILGFLLVWGIVSQAQAASNAINLKKRIGLPSDIVVYINWDGFASYYVDLAEQQGKIPTLTRIKDEEGIYFTRAYTSIPSITDPMQIAIIAGTTPRYTNNAYRYFDKKRNCVIQETPPRKNEAETLAEAITRQNHNLVAINQFAVLNRGAVVDDPSRFYLNAAANVNGDSDAGARFDAAIVLIKTIKSLKLSARQMPKLIALYMDDLDGIGHNESNKYGMKTVIGETARRQAVVDRLNLMDRKLGEFIEVCKTEGIYSQMSFVLTSDHGMAPFGLQQSVDENSRTSKLPELIKAIESLGAGYKCEVLHPNATQSPSSGTDIALVTVGLQVQLSYVGVVDARTIQTKNEKVKAILNGKSYIGKMMGPEEMALRGVKNGFADLIVSPQPPYHFHLARSGMPTRGQHDSLSDEAQHIASFMWGKGIKKGMTAYERSYNYDFTPTMARLLGITAPLDATGKVLDDFLETESPRINAAVTMEDRGAEVHGSSLMIETAGASGGTATKLAGPQATLEFVQVPKADKLIIRYATSEDGKLAFYLNDKFVRDVFFPAVNNSTNYAEKQLNIALKPGDAIRLVNEPAHDCTGVVIDCITFFAADVPKA